MEMTNLRDHLYGRLDRAEVGVTTLQNHLTSTFGQVQKTAATAQIQLDKRLDDFHIGVSDAQSRLNEGFDQVHGNRFTVLTAGEQNSPSENISTGCMNTIPFDLLVGLAQGIRTLQPEGLNDASLSSTLSASTRIMETLFGTT